VVEGNSDTGIRVEGLARSFGAVHAVRDISFEAPAGRVTGLIGPNGSGKTTLLLMLATLLVPDRGSIRIEGWDPVTEFTRVRTVMGWMPDALGSWATLTVRATLELTGRLYGFDRERAAARAAELIELVDLSPLADRPTRVLSRGQKQRMGLARALVHDPRVLLLDEPASGLDPTARVALRQLVRRLADEGRTILISSHILSELDELTDTAVFLEEGRTADPARLSAARAKPREWRIRSMDAAALQSALTATGTPTRPGELGDDLVVQLAGDAAAAALLAQLVEAKVPITAFAPAVGELEHTFLDLAGDPQ
jgi:ABC-2 type transport system ATP-binding protein